MKSVAVASRSDYGLLFEALERMFPVRFLKCDPDQVPPCDAVIWADWESGSTPSTPPGTRFCYLSCRCGSQGPNRASAIQFSRSSQLDERLRGRTMRHMSELRPLEVHGSPDVLALAGGRVIWAVENDGIHVIHRVSGELANVPPGKGLHEYLRPNQFFSLLPLIHFLRNVTRDECWEMPPIRANYLFDDPNLHWPTYGFINFPSLAEHARRHGYHVAFATIPLDNWFTHPRAAEVFASNPGQFSMLIHGNNHMRAEMARQMSDPAIMAMLNQCLGRVVQFEQRTHMPISRVMAPPHDVCTTAYARLMRQFRIDAITTSDIFKWVDPTRIDVPTHGVRPIEIVEGIPVIKRIYLMQALEPFYQDDIVLDAFMGKPIILYGHHQDLANGYDILAELTRFVDSLGNVEWTDFDTIMRGSFARRRSGAKLEIKSWSRRLNLDLPVDANELVIEKTGIPDPADEVIVCDRDQGDVLASIHEDRERIWLLPGMARRLDIRFQQPAGTVPERYQEHNAILRRILTESRDRLSPFCLRLVK
ncbi:hypothetical protein LLG95_14800 [bacterium]|nr:hypothetical protein [bacterium]